LPKNATIASAQLDGEAATDSSAKTAAALPLGERIVVDPWDDRLVMLKAEPEGSVAEYEKMPFQIAPFLLYLTRQGSNEAGNQAGTVAVKSETNGEQTTGKP
jgi:hypothetical protein